MLEASRHHHRLCLAVWKQRAGERSLRVARCLYNLGNVETEMGHLEAALAYYDDALARQKEKLSPNDPRIVATLSAKAAVFTRLGDYDEAVKLYEQVLEIQKTLGDDLATATTMKNLAVTLRPLGDFHRAAELAEESRQRREKVLGPNHELVAYSLEMVGMCRADEGRYADATAAYRRTRAILDKPGSLDSHLASVLLGLADLDRQMGDFDEAVDACRAALRIIPKAVGKQHPTYASGLATLGEIRMSEGDDADAIPLLREALAIQQQVL